MKDKKEKAELLEWLKRLKEYAVDNSLSMRIRDGIDDCIEMAEMRNPDMEEIKSAVEELLESISNKVMPPAEKNTREENGISIEEIREQITGMARRCQSENAESLQNLGERKQAVIQKAYFGLQEITHCEAHMYELKNIDRYLHFFEQVKVNYEKDAMHIFKEFLDDLANNYRFMIEHMKSMFRSIGGEKGGFGSRRFYEEHDLRREEIAGKLETVAQNSDCGGTDIEELGNATKKKISNIVQKSIFRMRFFILLPILIIFLFFIARSVLVFVNMENSREKMTQEQETNEELNVRDVLSIISNLAESFSSSKAVKYSEKLKKTVIIVAAFMLLLLIVIYAMYIKLLKGMCDRRICNRCNVYLQLEWSQFKQRDPLMQKMDSVLHDLQEEYNRQYLDLLNQLFRNTEYNVSHGNKKDQFEILKEEWSAIK